MPILYTHSLPKGNEKERAAALQEGPGLLSPLSQLLCTSPWNLAILCDLPLNPGCLGYWSCCENCPFHPVPISFHSINLPVWAPPSLRLEEALAEGWGGGWWEAAFPEA